MITRPDVHEVARYRQFVDRAMAEAFTAGTFDERTISRIELGLHHEQQHQELLLMDALHLMAQNPLQPAYDDGLSPAQAGAPRSSGSSAVARPKDAGAGTTAGGTPGAGLLEHDGGLLDFGHDGAGSTAGDGHSGAASFGYDNEGPRHRQWLEPFAIDDRLVTCGDWIEFIEDGGYERADLWLSNGWALLSEHDWQAPAYWSPADDGWHHFTLAGPTPVDPVVPVAHVSYHEADAFARWRGARLPTEFEWEAVARDHWQPARRGTCPPLRPQAAGSAGADPHQFTGEVWQWTSSAYLPYPGFSPTAGAIGEYNGKFMVDQHVLRGSSALTPPGHERLTYRNFFPPASRWAATGVRLAHDC